jgi:peptidoglycan/LPS O-acetylase OafA/YrhL
VDVNGDVITSNLKSLTSLRFFAAAFVVLLHIGQVLPPAAGFESIFALGYTGVTFFFILSGVVLTWSYRVGDRARPFYWRRFARVWPLHLLTTAAAACWLASQAGTPDLLALAFVVPLLHAFVPSPAFYYAYNGPSWSLACEAFFYALFPLLIVRATAARRPAVNALLIFTGMVVVAVVTVVFSPVLAEWTGQSAVGFVGYFLNIFPPYRLGEFLIGVCIGTMLRKGWRSPVRPAVAVGVTLGTVAALSSVNAILVNGGAAIPLPLVGLIVIAPFALLISSAASGDLLQRPSFLQMRWLVTLGEASFALYLVHHLVLQVAARIFEDAGVGLSWPVAIGAAATAVIAAHVAHKYFEQPLERLIRRRFGTRSSPAPAPSITH